MGIILFDVEGNRYLVNGYGNNNGYYSTDLSLSYSDSRGKLLQEVDISDCQKISF